MRKMQKIRLHQKKADIGILATAFCFGVAASLALFGVPKSKVTIGPEALTPWGNVGGCGGGGSGGGSGDGIKWIGSGVSGGLIDIEVLPKFNFGQNFQNFTIAPRFSFKPTWTTIVGISVPVVSKTGESQFTTAVEPSDRTTGGLGDLSVDIARSFGMSGQHSLSLALTVPTGQYDIKRGPDNGEEFLPSSLQKGGGIYSATLGLSTTKDVEDGMWMFDLISFSYPFNMKLLSGQNEMMEEYFPQEMQENRPGNSKNERFYYRFKPYGESDLGAFTPPSLSSGVYYAYRGIAGYTHSWGVTFSAPLGVAFVNGPNPNVYDPRPDPDHQAWSGAFAYGMEIHRNKLPIFMAVSLPIHAKAPEVDEYGGEKKWENQSEGIYNLEPFRKWNAPDWSDFGQQWTFALGFKATLF